MAIDSALKRYSAMNIASPWRPVLPLPDGTVDADDRAIVAYLYGGISADEPAPSGGSFASAAPGAMGRMMGRS